MLIEKLQNIIPNSIKQILKPYFRVIFPNKIMSVWWITYRCNYKCSYCPYCGTADYSKMFPKSCEKTGQEWIEALEKLPPTSFYISGGEPFLYKDLPYIINNLPEQHSIIGIVTNASMPIEIYNKVNKKIHLNISFHREFTTEDEFIKKVLLLKDKFSITVNIVAVPDNYNFIKNKIGIFEQNGISFHIDPFVENANQHYNYNKDYEKLLEKYICKDRNDKKIKKIYNTQKKCSAGKNYYNLLPNGDALICSRATDYMYSPLLEQVKDKMFELGNVFNGTFKMNTKTCICKYNCTNHCDYDYAKIDVIKKLGE